MKLPNWIRNYVNRTCHSQRDDKSLQPQTMTTASDPNYHTSKNAAAPEKQLHFQFTSGTEFPEDLSPYAMVIHCGGCMLNEREMKSRMRHCADCQIPMTNYGTAIAKMNGILERSLEVFPAILENLK